MMDRRTVVILVLACLAAFGGWWLQDRWLNPLLPAQPVAPAGVQTLAIGDPVGAYRLPDPDGQVTALAKWHGKILLLNFWATWCQPCRREMPMLAEFQRKHAADGLQVVGIAMDQPQSARAFLEHLPIGYPILIGIDADPVPTTVFGDSAGLLPFSVLVGRDGRILATKLGPLDPQLLDEWLQRASSTPP